MDKTRYSTAFQGLTASDTVDMDVELALHVSHANSCLNSFAGSPFNVRLALGILFLMDYELHDLLTIINAKVNNITGSRITESLIL
jgi:hypothetical protein